MVLKLWHILGFIFTVILGGLLHFTYQFSNKNLIVGYFSAVNESTWEHLKLLITPFTIFSMIEYFIYGKDINNFIMVRALSMLLGMITIIIVFYTYTGIIGNNYLVLDISTFILGVVISYYFSYNILQTNLFYDEKYSYIGLLIIFLVIFFMIYFTVRPPRINLFLDPGKNTYGI